MLCLPIPPLQNSPSWLSCVLTMEMAFFVGGKKRHILSKTHYVHHRMLYALQMSYWEMDVSLSISVQSVGFSPYSRNVVRPIKPFSSQRRAWQPLNLCLERRREETDMTETDVWNTSNKVISREIYFLLWKWRWKRRQPPISLSRLYLRTYVHKVDCDE